MSLQGVLSGGQKRRPLRSAEREVACLAILGVAYRGTAREGDLEAATEMIDQAIADHPVADPTGTPRSWARHLRTRPRRRAGAGAWAR